MGANLTRFESVVMPMVLKVNRTHLAWPSRGPPGSERLDWLEALDHR